MAIWRRRAGAAEREAQEEIDALREWRHNRFRILVCVDGSEESYKGLRFAAQIGRGPECDIILLYVRPIDQGLRSGGLQIRVARENMMDWGLDLPGVRYLRDGLDLLIAEGHMAEDWDAISTHTDLRGDPLGDNKVEYRDDNGKGIVLKLKTAPDTASGILDQYELGPYNVIIIGAPSRWQGELRSFFDAGVAQKVAMLAPCSVLVAREEMPGKGHMICTDGSDRSLDALRRSAVLSHHIGAPLTLLSVAPDSDSRTGLKKQLEDAASTLGEMGVAVTAVMTRVGDPVEEIVDAGKDYALITVSDSGKSRLKRFVVGSVAFSVMGQSGTSVLNVR